MLGPALAPGSLLTLDAAFVPRIPVPAGVWGLGPELPRRLPLGVVLAWASGVAGGAAAGKALLAASLVVAFSGACRLVGDQPWPTQITSGVLYALSPLVLTRVGAGQWTALAAFAVLPWALPTLLAPSASLTRTFLWASAMALTGSVGGVLCLLAVAAGVLPERSPASLRAGALAVLAQLPWVVPAVVVGTGGTHRAGSAAFATRASGLSGIAGLFAGHGFWRAPSQVGGDSNPATALLGMALLALAVVGAGALPRAWRWRAAGLAAGGLALALASALPGARQLYADLTGTAIGGPLREGQRQLVLLLAWLAPAAALGARRLAAAPGRLASPLTVGAPLIAAAVLAAPGLWGVGGRLAPADIPADWGAARQLVDRAPGTVLALPFHRYLDLPAAGGRRVLNPVPDYLGGDVLSSSDPELGPSGRELDDPRESAVRHLLGGAASGQPVATALAAAGVRWVVVLHAADWRSFAPLAADTGLRHALAGPTLDLYSVREWRGPVTDEAGRALLLRPVVAPLEHLAPSAAAVWSRPAASGWMRGWRAATRDRWGRVRLPPGRGLVWFWPAVPVLAVDAAAALAVAVVVARRRARPPRARRYDRGT